MRNYLLAPLNACPVYVNAAGTSSVGAAAISGGGKPEGLEAHRQEGLLPTLALIAETQDGRVRTAAANLTPFGQINLHCFANHGTEPNGIRGLECRSWGETDG